MANLVKDLYMKTCREKGCYFPVFSGLYCKYHQYKKNAMSPKKRSSFTRKNLKYDTFLIKQDRELYMEIWNERLHVCYSCGTSIIEPKTYNFHHLLEKGKERYKHLRHEKDNIMILCANCHCSTTNGFPPSEVLKQTQIAFKHFRHTFEVKSEMA